MKNFVAGAIALSLVVIALNMTVQTFRSSDAVQNTASVERTRVEILPVLTKAYTNYNTMGVGSTGFVVKEAAGLGFVEFDEGSRLGMVETPEFLLRMTRGETSVIQPLFLPTAAEK